MAVSELMMKGLDLLVLGMGTVFLFLTMMVAAVALMSKLAQRIEGMLPQPEPAEPPKGHIAAIAAAVRRYRAGRFT